MSAGFSFVEIIVALFILSIVCLGNLKIQTFLLYKTIESYKQTVEKISHESL